MKCRECEHWQLNAWPPMAALGWGECGVAEHPGIFTSSKRDFDCEKFKQASEETIFKRNDWLIKRELI